MSVYVDIEKRLGNFLLKVKLQGEEETIALLGASGCGKTMTLKCIAGIEKPDRGKILVDGVTLFDSEKGINLSPQERRTGYLFQNYALFPNMTVLQNLASAAKREKNNLRRKDRIEKTIEAFGLEEFLHRLPHTLSGGQQQRVALARILISQPDILLLDEPFSALDSHLRLTMEQQVRNVIRQFGKTVILVSHNRDEVYRMSDRVAILEDGSIAEYGDKDRIYQEPKSLAGAKMLGFENLIPVEMARTLGFRKTVPPEICALGFRAKDLVSDDAGTECCIKDRSDSPESTALLLQPLVLNYANTLVWKLPRTCSYQVGDHVKIRIPEDCLLPLQDGSERGLL